MSSKKLKPNQLSANNEEFDSNGESFSGRICNDLCEVLLSYLSFEDKIRFECVSKQWQKLIYNKQYILEVNETSDKSKSFYYKIYFKPEEKLLEFEDPFFRNGFFTQNFEEIEELGSGSYGRVFYFDILISTTFRGLVLYKSRY